MLLLPGRTEYLEKYAPIASQLTARGLSVASLDWRGQGASDRDSGVGRLGHVGDFSEYQEDLSALLSWVDAGGTAAGKRLMLAHSMGGCIGLRAMHDGVFSVEGRRLCGAVFSAPMWGLALPSAARKFAHAAARTAVRLGLGRKRSRGLPSETTYVLDSPFEGNVLVQDARTWERFRQEARSSPDLTLGSPTLSWLDAAFREMRSLERADVADLPPRLLLLGDEEAVVSPRAIRAHAEHGRGALLADIAGARHEPLMEPADRRPGRDVWEAIDAFVQDRVI